MRREEIIEGLYSFVATMSKRGYSKEADLCREAAEVLEDLTVAKTVVAPSLLVNRGIILESALRCVCHDRNAQYGEPEDNFRIIGDFWSLYLGKEITPHDVGVMRALFKVGRIMGGGVKDDNYIDACGYLACAGEIAARLQEGN